MYGGLLISREARLALELEQELDLENEQELQQEMLEGETLTELVKKPEHRNKSTAVNKGRRTKPKAKRDTDNDEESSTTPTSKKFIFTLAELVIVNPLENIHGEPILPKEEIMKLEDIHLPKFLVDLKAEKNKILKRR